MLIERYSRFIESKNLDFLLEARMIYTKNFIDILNQIVKGSDGEVQKIADWVLKLQNRDIDINTNWIDSDPEKEGYIKFIPETKYKEGEWTVVDADENYRSLTLKIDREMDERPELVEILKKYGFVGPYTRLGAYPVENGTVGKVIPISLEDIKKLSPGNDDIWNQRYETKDAVVMFIHKTENERIDLCLFDQKGLLPIVDAIKPQDFGVGRFVKRILQKAAGLEVSDKDLEAFVNKWKAIINIKKDTLKRFQIVKGEDIRKYYLAKNYNKEEYSLGGSCMRYSKCQKYLDIYVDNPEVCNLIILKAEPRPPLPGTESKEEDKIQGRALLWTDDKGRKIMDRVYVSNFPDEQIFIEFARKNGFIWKSKQDNDEDTSFIQNGEPLKGERFKILLKQHDYEWWPYMDTFKFYTVRAKDGKSSLTNYDGSWDYKLEETNGGNGICRECGGENRVECSECGGSGTAECRECDGRGEITCNNCTRGKVDCWECSGSGEFECRTCDGSGKDPDNKELDCTDCKGKGTTDCEDCNGTGAVNCEDCDGSAKVECPECSGQGDYDCPECYGHGRVDCPECS